ncbi:hypothetical protein LCGC14_1369390, partial [marine sediment metagenome]
CNNGVVDIYFEIFGFLTPPKCIQFGSAGVVENTPSDLGANVSGAVGSVFPIVLLSIGIFLAFYIIQQLMFMFAGVQPKKRRVKRRKQ